MINLALEILAEMKNYSLYTYHHSLKVSFYCLILASKIGYQGRELNDILIIGLLHDIGKLKVPKSILNKPGKLTGKEYEIIKKHPILGKQVLIELGIKDEQLISSVLYHHERMDGKGYPRGIIEDDISLKTKIITIADALDAMTTSRPYRTGLDINSVKDEFKRNAGYQFDKKIVKVLLKYINEFPINLSNDYTDIIFNDLSVVSVF